MALLTRTSSLALPVSGRLLWAGLIGLLAIAGLVALVTLPDQREREELDRSIASLEARIAEQRRLGPAYAELLARNRQGMALQLPLPKATPLKGDQIGELSRSLESMASGAHLTVLHLTPTPLSLGQKTPMLMVECVLNGQFTDVRDFLARVGGVAAFRQVERLTVQSGAGQEQIQLTLSFLFDPGEGRL